MEAWEKVFFDNEAYFETVHASISCIACHGGTDGVGDVKAAHEGMVRDPDSATACGTCHAQTVESFGDNSLHWDLGGYMTVLQERSDEEHWPQVMEAYDNHCAKCHASCGQCHVSRPTSNGGGLLDGHVFKGTPPPYSTCTGCHGSRIENEFKGKNTDEEGSRYPADVHYNPGGMHCHDCHSSDEMHGATGDPVHRYDGAATPSCTDAGCHEDIGSSEIVQHSAGHLERISCQACHTVPYKNCYNCHVEQSDEGVPFFRTDESQMLFRIGLNPVRSSERPWKYVPVRHVPIARDSFSYYGEGLLPNFDSRPTWTYATPHSIQRVTPQNQGCDCHTSLTLFLTVDDVNEDELAANQTVIIAEAPLMALSEEPAVELTAEPTAAPEEATPTETPPPIPPPEAYTGPETCSACHADQYERWSDGPHAHAYDNPDFQDKWAATDQNPQCLTCHTDDLAVEEQVHAGVTCATCHNAFLQQGHPPAVDVRVPPDAQVCADCHTTTAREWYNSKHGQGNIQCQACHTPHTRNLKAQSAELCIGCHEGYQEDETHLSHASQQFGCLDCHLYIDPGQETPDGLINTAHSFVAATDARDCIRCHTDSSHMEDDATETLNEHALELGCAVCHTPSGVTDSRLTMHDVMEASKSLNCEDCHSEGNFDWTAAGYSTEEAAELIWSENPSIESSSYPSESNGLWLLGIGIIIIIAVAAPFIPRRESHWPPR